MFNDSVIVNAAHGHNIRAASSRKATSAWGRKPSTLRFSLSFSKAFKDNGPKTSSGTSAGLAKVAAILCYHYNLLPRCAAIRNAP